VVFVADQADKPRLKGADYTLTATPVSIPEPALLILLGSGRIAVSLKRRRSISK